MPLPGDNEQPATRTESDTLGDIEVPASALWGASTQRAKENFQISEHRFGRTFIQVLGYLKAAAAKANLELWRLDDARVEAIEAAATEVASGQWDDQFVVDVFQTGSGSSTNMNANEVIANRANAIGRDFKRDLAIHPIDHVNLGQSSNDVIPSVIHVSALIELRRSLLPTLVQLHEALEVKGEEFHETIKTGRAHLMDATPVRLGQEFTGYASLISRGIARLRHTQEELKELAIGGTAVGTGVNTHPDFAAKVCHHLYQYTGIKVKETDDHFAAQSAIDPILALSAALRNLAVSLQKIANDIRWMASGPRAGIGELELQVLQPGSSSMPGKIEPVIPEAIIQVAGQVIACDAAILQAAQGGNFELNTMLPMAAYNLLEAISLLARGADTFTTRCIRTLEATGQGPALLGSSLMLVTALVPVVGHEKAAEVAGMAYENGRTIHEAALELTDLSGEELAILLDPQLMVEPQTKADLPPPPKRPKDPFDPR